MSGLLLGRIGHWRNMKYLICGFMGCGKSTLLAKFEANSNTYQCYDLDHEIHSQHGSDFNSLGEFIEANGWDHFRRVEMELLDDFLARDQPLVLALGGGALSGVNLTKIKKNESAKLIFLDVPFEVCLERISGDSNRPMLKLGEEKLQQLYSERLPLYKCADIQLDLDKINQIDSPEQFQGL